MLLEEKNNNLNKKAEWICQTEKMSNGKAEHGLGLYEGRRYKVQDALQRLIQSCL